MWRSAPSLRDAVWWALPAIAVGALIRCLYLSYAPLAHWGADSMSFFEFAWKALDKQEFVLNEKRRYLYPIALLPMSLLPGGAMRWVAWIQHASALLVLIPFAYIIRKCFAHWRWWIVPLTLVFATWPAAIVLEHIVQSDALFLHAIVWAAAGWVAWVSSPAGASASAHRFWWFAIPFFAALLTRPAARFFLPAVLAGLVITGAWRALHRSHWIASAAVLVVQATMGKEKMVAMLLLGAVFPLVQLETPLLAEYKQELREEVERSRQHLGLYYRAQIDVFKLLKRPERYPEKPRFSALAEDDVLTAKVYKGLAIEACRSQPWQALLLALQRVAASADYGDNVQHSFKATVSREWFDGSFEELTGRKKLAVFNLLMGRPRKAPPPPWEEVAARLSPYPRAPAARWMAKGADFHADTFRWVWPPSAANRNIPVERFRPSWMAWVALAGAVLAFCKRWRGTLGVFVLWSGVYLVGAFLIGESNPRLFAPVVPLLFLLLPAAADAALSLGRARAPGGHRS
jgi:hypothetical protein